MGRRGARDARGGGGAPKGGLREALEAELAAEVAALLGSGAAEDLDLEALETGLRRRVLALAARALERSLDADRSDHVGPTIACGCGGTARYAGRRPKTFTPPWGT